MKVWVALLNISQLVFALALLADKGPPSKDEFWIVLILFAAPSFTLFYLFWRARKAEKSESLFGLFVERLKLEQQARISKLKQSNES